MRIIPRSGTTKDVLLLLALEYASRVDGFGNGMFEGAGAAFEAVGALVCEGDGEDVGALGADYVLDKESVGGFWRQVHLGGTYRAAWWAGIL